MSRTSYRYLLGGLHVLSEIRLTGVAPSVSMDAPEVQVILHTPRDSPADAEPRAAYDHTCERSVIHIPGVAIYEITGGTRIDVTPLSFASRKDVEIFLCGLAWATMCHQRRVLPVHASAVATSGGIIAFMGPSGAGKSTTAALMSGKGSELITDDVLPLTVDPFGRPGAWPYLQRLKLKADALHRLHITGTEVVSERLDRAKSFVLSATPASQSWRPLRVIFVLDPEGGDGHAVATRLIAVDAVTELVRNTYHFEFVRSTKGLGENLVACGRIASTVPVYRLSGLPHAGVDEIATIIANTAAGHLADPAVRSASDNNWRRRVAPPVAVGRT